LSQVAHHAGEAAEHEGNGQHANGHDRFLQIAAIARQLIDTGPQRFLAGQIRPPGGLGQDRLGDDQLAHQIDELIHLLHAHADG